MKEEKTIFTCDMCTEKEEVFSNEIFPYEKGWISLGSFYFKISRGKPSPHLVREAEEKGKHFCKMKCMLEYIGRHEEEIK